MKAVILAGGFGTRLSEETTLKPKPLVEIGNKPILLHIMKIYLRAGVSDFVVLGGYKAEMIKHYFANFVRNASRQATYSLKDGFWNEEFAPQNDLPEFKVTVLDTGLESGTAERLLLAKELLQNDEAFFLTYGDGLADVDIWRVEEERKRSNWLTCLTGVIPPARYGSLQLLPSRTEIEGLKVEQFAEKNEKSEGYVNGGFMSISSEIFEEISPETVSIEQDLLPRLSASGRLGAVLHLGFWQSMDTLRDKKYLDELWTSGQAPW